MHFKEFVGQIFRETRQELAGEGIAVRVEPLRWQTDENVAGSDGLAGQHMFSFDATDNETGEIVFAGSIHAGHFGCFAADESAAIPGAAARDTRDDTREHLRIELSDCEVVEEKQWSCTLYCDVVHAVIDEIFTHGIVAASSEGDFELCAYSVGGTDQNGITPTFQREAGAKTADGSEDVLVKSFRRQAFDLRDSPFRLVNVHTGVAVGCRSSHYEALV